MLSKWNLPKPEIIADVAAGDKCVIVDTNNPAELPASINEADVIEMLLRQRPGLRAISLGHHAGSQRHVLQEPLLPTDFCLVHGSNSL